MMVNYSKSAKKPPQKQKVHVNKTVRMEQSHAVQGHPMLSVDDRQVHPARVSTPPTHDAVDVVSDDVMDVLNDSVPRAQAIRSMARLSRRAKHGEVILLDSMRKHTPTTGEVHRPGKSHVTYAQDQRSTANSENSIEQHYTNSFGNEGRSRPSYTEEMEDFREYVESKRSQSRVDHGREGSQRELSADTEAHRVDDYDGLDF